jgi:C_GCAxxG_C_C family probable redox protein
MAESELRQRARSLFLDDANSYGCAEVTLLTLQRRFRVLDRVDSSAVMTLNGGVAYSGEICGVLSGGAVAAGLIAESQVRDHAAAKRRARAAAARLVEEFRREFGAVRCQELIGCDLRTKERHDAFILSGAWRTVCMAQIEFGVNRLSSLMEEPGLGEAPASSGGAE